MVRKIYQWIFIIIYLVSLITIEFYLPEKNKKTINNNLVSELLTFYFLLELLSTPSLIYEIVRMRIKQDHTIRNYLFIGICMCVVYLFFNGHYLWITD